MDRRDFYYRQRLTQAELDDTFDKVELADHAIVKEVMGFGFFGAPVPVEAAVPDLTIDIPTLIGYDQLGQRLEVPVALAPFNVNCAIDEVAASTAVVSPGNEKILAVFMEFDRDLLDPRVDGNGTTVYWERNEHFKFNVVQSAEASVGTAVPPPLRNDQILICDVTLIYNQTTILDADIDTDRREDFNYLSLTPSYLGALLSFIGRALQPANLTAPSAVDMVVTTEMSGKTAGGSASSKGVITSNPENYVKIFDDDGDNFLDAAGNKVYGRLTESSTVWTLSFYSLVEGTPATETAFDMTAFAGETIVWYVQQVYSLDDFPVADPMFAIQSDQIAGEIPDATTTLKGKVELADDGEALADKVVQGNDARLLGTGALAFIRKLSSRPSLIFMHEDSANFDTFLLHQYHGMAFGDYTGGGASNYYFEFDKDHTDYPLAVEFDADGVTEGPGLADNTGASIVWTSSGKAWYYIYLIGRPTSHGSPNYSLVCSTQPPDTGPLLDNSVYDFPLNGWTHWKFIGAVVNMDLTGTTWEFAQTRKIGNHVSYECAMYMMQTATTVGSWADLSLDARVPITSMRAEISMSAECTDGAVALKVRPPAPAANELGLREVPAVGPSTIPGARDCVLQVGAYEFANLGVAGAEIAGWVDLNDQQEIGWNAGSVSSPSSVLVSILVNGYEEFDDIEGTSFTWT